ncbi:MAG: hypothetical protein IPI67_05795 [Myxococcales bacterium]|nr:hypothetical protein [Myxococcales bacterium]
MSPRVERQTRAVTQSDEGREPAAVPKSGAKSNAPAKAPSGSRKAELTPSAAQLTKNALPSPFFWIQKRQPRLDGKQARSDEALIQAAFRQQSGVAIDTKPRAGRVELVGPPAQASKLVIRPMMSALEPAAPVAVRFEAGKRLAALEAVHSRAKSLLERSIAHFTNMATDLRRRAVEDAKHGTFREGLDGAVWNAELQASHARALLKELKSDFAAAKFAYEALLGRAAGSGVRAGNGVDAHVDTASPAERFLQKLERYNRSIETVRSSGFFAPIVGAAKGVAAALHGRELDAEDYRILDGIYQLGQSFEVPIGIRFEQRGITRGAAPAAPGVDHRAEVKNAIRDNLTDARQPRAYDR